MHPVIDFYCQLLALTCWSDALLLMYKQYSNEDFDTLEVNLKNFVSSSEAPRVSWSCGLQTCPLYLFGR